MWYAGTAKTSKIVENKGAFRPECISQTFEYLFLCKLHGAQQAGLHFYLTGFAGLYEMIRYSALLSQLRSFRGPEEQDLRLP